MDSFEGRLAVVTGGGTGMGRELVIQLATAGCSVATCDINAENMSETAKRAGKDAPTDVRITTHVAKQLAAPKPRTRLSCAGAAESG
jgi:NAD(P)-dependent dehydrogenase (short-subunit alcohol dehydrogenase family)